MHLLNNELTRFTELRRRLIEADADIDETTLADTLEGATDVKEAIGHLIRSALEDEAMATGLKGRLDDLKRRLERIQARGEKKRHLALEAMEAVDMEKITQPDFTASLRIAPPRVVITCEENIPELYWTEQRPKLDKRRLLDTLKAGSRIAGAELSNSRVTLAVRTN